MSVLEQILTARKDGNLDAFAALIPYARFLGMQFAREGDELLVRMDFSDHLIGNPGVPAIHGGAIGSVLETAAILETLWAYEVITVPKTINLTIDYLRPARPETTWARARVTKRGRRVMSLHVEAWQSDRDRLTATALVHLLVQTRSTPSTGVSER